MSFGGRYHTPRVELLPHHQNRPAEQKIPHLLKSSCEQFRSVQCFFFFFFSFLVRLTSPQRCTSSSLDACFGSTSAKARQLSDVIDLSCRHSHGNPGTKEVPGAPRKLGRYFEDFADVEFTISEFLQSQVPRSLEYHPSRRERQFCLRIEFLFDLFFDARELSGSLQSAFHIVKGAKHHFL